MKTKLILTLLTLLSLGFFNITYGQTIITDPYHELHLKRLAESIVYKTNLQETFENGHYNTNLPLSGTSQYLRTVVNYIGKAAENCIEFNVDVTRKLKLDMVTAQLYRDVNKLLDEANSQIQLYRSDKDINGYLEIPGGKYWDLPGVPSSMDIDANTYFPTIPTQGIMRDVTRQTPTNKFINIYVVDEILIGGAASDIKSTAFNKIIIDQSSDQDLASIIVATKYIDPASQAYEPEVLVKALGQFLGLLPTYSGSLNGQCPPEWNEINGVIPNPLASLDPVFGDGIQATEMMPNNIPSCSMANPCNNTQSLLDPKTASNVMAGLPCSVTFNEEQTKIMHRFINEYLSDAIFGKSFWNDETSFEDCNPGVIEMFENLVFDDGIPLLLSGVLEMDLWVQEILPNGEYLEYTMSYNFPVPMTGVYFHEYQFLRGTPDPGFYVDYKITAKGVCGNQTIELEREAGRDLDFLPGCAAAFLILENYEEGNYMASDPPIFKRTKTNRSGKLAKGGVNQSTYNFGPFYNTYEMSDFNVSDGSISIASTAQGKYGNFEGNKRGDEVNVELYGETEVINSTIILGESETTQGNLTVEEYGLLELDNAIVEINNGSKITVKDHGLLKIKGETTVDVTSPNSNAIEIKSGGGILEMVNNSVLNLTGSGIVSIRGDLLLKNNLVATINVGKNVQLDIEGLLDIGENSKLTINGNGVLNLFPYSLDLDASANLSIYGSTVSINGETPTFNVNLHTSINITNEASLWFRNVNLNLLNSSYLSSNGSFRLDACLLQSSGRNESVYLYGQENTRISGCKFKDFNKAIVLNNYATSTPYRTRIANNDFINCKQSVISEGRGLMLTGNNFVSQSEYGVAQINSTVDSWVSGNTFHGHEYALEAYGVNMGELNINSSDFIGNYQAIVAEYSDVILRCSNIESGLPEVDQSLSFTPTYPPTFQFNQEVVRDAGLSLFNCQLDISDNRLNNFINLEYAVRSEESKSIFINNGGNIFHNPGYAIAGQLNSKYDNYYLDGGGYTIYGYKNVIPESYQVFDIKNPIDVNTVTIYTSSGAEIELKTDNLPSFESCVVGGTENPVEDEIDAVIKVIQKGAFDEVELLVNGTPAARVFEQAINMISTPDEKRNSAEGINKLLDILEIGLSSIDDKEQYLLQLVYDELLKAYGIGAYYKEVELNEGVRGSAIDPLLNRILNYIDSKATIAGISQKEYEVLQIDKVALLLTAQYFEKAMNILNSTVFSEDRLSKKSDELYCVSKSADKFWNNEITNLEFSNTIINCRSGELTISSRKANDSMKVSNNSDFSNLAYVYPTIQGSDSYIINLKGEKRLNDIYVYNSLGEVLNSRLEITGIGTELVNINTSSLPNGVYIIKSTQGGINNVTKFVVQR